MRALPFAIAMLLSAGAASAAEVTCSRGAAPMSEAETYKSVAADYCAVARGSTIRVELALGAECWIDAGPHRAVSMIVKGTAARYTIDVGDMPDHVSGACE